MQPSCGCIILDKSSHIIIPEDGIRQFKATYNSIKNVGEVVHRIRIFGNMLPNGKAELKFDVNVVPDADYTRDIELLTLLDRVIVPDGIFYRHAGGTYFLPAPCKAERKCRQ